MNRLFGVLFALCLMLAGGPAQAVTQTDIIGGSGGGNWRLQCIDDALVGLQIRQGDAVDRVTLICAQVHKEKYLGEPYLSDQTMGGDGGSVKTMQCPRDSWVTGMTVQADGPDVNDIAISCTNIVTGERSFKSVDYNPATGLFEGEGIGSEPQGIGCGKGKLAVGVNGRADNLVHAIGLVCTNDPFQTASNPAPANKGNWAAFAKGNGNYWGYAHSRPDVSKAAQDAMSGCGGLNNGCNVFWTTQAACIAFAMSGPPYYYAAGGGANKQAAEQNAIKYCQSGNAPAGACQIQMSSCQGN